MSKEDTLEGTHTHMSKDIERAAVKPRLRMHKGFNHESDHTDCIRKIESLSKDLELLE